MRFAIALVLLAVPSAAAGRPRPASDVPPRSEEFLWTVGPRDDGPRKPPPPVTAALREQGRKTYRANCGRCHGTAGDGRGVLAAALPISPTDFTRAVFKLRSTPTGTLPTDVDLFVTISRGMHGTPMMPWRQLPERDRWALVAHIKSFSRRFADEGQGHSIPVPLAPRESATLQDRGEQLYVHLRCGACHGDQGAADGPARAALQFPRERGVRIRDFTRGRFIRGVEMEDVYLTLRLGIDGVPMPPLVDLDDHDLWALAAYVRLLVKEQPLHRLPPARAAPGAGQP